MIMIIITDEANKHLRKSAILNWRQEGYQAPSGNWHIPVSNNVYDRLLEYKMPTETLSEAIIRLTNTQYGTH